MAMDLSNKTSKDLISLGLAQGGVAQPRVATPVQNGGYSQRIAFLEKCLDEYIRRRYMGQKRRIQLNELKPVIICLRNILEIYNPYSDDATWFNQFKRHYEASRSGGLLVPPVHRSVTLDLHDIVRSCGQNEQGISLTPEKKLDDVKANNKENEDPDECVIIETHMETIEISDDEDSSGKPNCVESYEDALRQLKPLEELALRKDNSEAIVLLTMLEDVFKTGGNDFKN